MVGLGAGDGRPRGEGRGANNDRLEANMNPVVAAGRRVTVRWPQILMPAWSWRGSGQVAGHAPMPHAWGGLVRACFGHSRLPDGRR